ncbi:MAG: S9 family peptidase [Proteobacteria bacterium]|nr:S9 family peptidase [Pseudomonadota bacterium]
MFNDKLLSNSILAAITFALPLSSAMATSYGPDDVCGTIGLQDPAISPDGSAVVFVLRTCDVATNKTTSDLWYVSTAPNAQPKQLTTNPASDHSPRWSTDGTSLAFVSSRSGISQIWRFDGFFGEPSPVTEQEGGASDPIWSPDSEYLLYSSRGPAMKVDILEGDDIGVHRDVLYRKSSHWEQGRHSHYFRIDAKGGTGEQVTIGDRDHTGAVFSPDGSKLAFVRSAQHQGTFSIDTDVWVMELEKSDVRPVTDNPGPDSHPQWTADGEGIVTRSVLEENYESGKRRLMLWSAKGKGKPVELTKGIDHHVFGVGSVFGDEVSVLIDSPGSWHVGRLKVDKPGQIEMDTSGRSWVWDFATTVDKTVAVGTDGSHPGELWLWEDNKDARRLTSFNDDFLVSRTLSHPQEHWLDIRGKRIHAWYYPPIGNNEGPPPMILTLHGGPQWCSGERWEPDIQALAGAGYAVLDINFTGSLGYGQGFIDAVAGDWGGAAYEDSIAAVDWAVEQGLADKKRIGITGGSYGGFLAAYAIGQTDRFGAAVVCRAVTEQISEYGTTDEQFFPEHDMPGTPWSNREDYWRWSPLAYVPQIKTPTMIIHSEGDHRVPVNQAEQFFTALVRHEVPAELVRFPGEGHGLSRTGTPVHRRERLEHMIRWFDAYLK